MPRRFIDAPDAQRCDYTVTLRDKSQARCGRYRKVGCLCRQHAKIVESRKPANVQGEPHSAARTGV